MLRDFLKKHTAIIRNTKNGLLSLLAKRTIGVRALVIQNDKVLLVKHTYQPQWYTIGGAVEAGETPVQALLREIKEEVGATANSSPKLFSVYYSHIEKHDDYIVFYIIDGVQLEAVNSLEIAEQQWFPIEQLPSDISSATQRRIDEYLGKTPISETW